MEALIQHETACVDGKSGIADFLVGVLGVDAEAAFGTGDGDARLSAKRGGLTSSNVGFTACGGPGAKPSVRFLIGVACK